MKRSLSMLLLLLLASCACVSTCVSYNSFIYRKLAQTVNQDSQGSGIAFNSGYPLANDASTQPSQASGYPLANDASTQPSQASGYPGSNGSSTQTPRALGYPPPLANPNVQRLVAAGYPAPCNAGAVNTVQHGMLSGMIAYTTYNYDPNQYNPIPNVKRIVYRYDGRKVTLGVPIPIANTLGADGITALPNGDLVVGSQQSRTYLLSPKSSQIKVATIGDAFSDHVTYDSQRNVIWTSGDSPFSDLAKIPLNTFANGIASKVKGDDSNVTQVAFDPSHKAYYTSSSPQGNGSFGIINLDTLTTIRKISNLPAAHGLSFDHFTNTLIAVGSNHITEINPVTFAVVSDWKAPANHSQLQLDQAATDGQGHLWATSNDGNILFIDYSRTRNIAAPTNYQFIQFVENRLDDVALLCAG